MEELKALLGDEVFATIAAKLGDKQVLVFEKDTKVLIDDGKLIPKYRLDEVAASRDSLKGQVEKATADLASLKKSVEGNTDLTTKIEELQGAAKVAKQEAERAEARLRKHFAVKESLMNAGVSDSDARDLLLTRFDLDKIEVDGDGKVKGFDEMVKPLRENKALAGMFATKRLQGQTHADGDLPPADLGEYANKNPFAKATLNIAKQVELLKTQPDLAAKLQAMATK